MARAVRPPALVAASVVALCGLPNSAIAQQRACLAVDRSLGRLPRRLPLKCASSSNTTLVAIGPGGCFARPPSDCEVLFRGRPLDRSSMKAIGVIRYTWPRRRRAHLLLSHRLRLRSYALDSTFPALRISELPTCLFSAEKGSWATTCSGFRHPLRRTSRTIAELLRKSLGSKTSQIAAAALRLELEGEVKSALNTYKRALDKRISTAQRRFVVSRIADLSLLTSPLAQQVPTLTTTKALLAKHKKATSQLANHPRWRCYLKSTTAQVWNAALSAAGAERPLSAAFSGATLPTRRHVDFTAEAFRAISATLSDIQANCARGASPLSPSVVSLGSERYTPPPLRPLPKHAPIRLQRRRGGHMVDLLANGEQLVILTSCDNALSLKKAFSSSRALSPLDGRKVAIVTDTSCRIPGVSIVNEEVRWALHSPSDLGYGVFVNRRLLFAAPLAASFPAVETAASIAVSLWERSRKSTK